MSPREMDSSVAAPLLREPATDHALEDRKRECTKKRPRRGVGEKKWIREWRSRMEQRLAVGGKRVTTGRLSSVVVDLFREAFPGPEPMGNTESVSRPRYAAVKDDVRIPDFAYSAEGAFQHAERIPEHLVEGIFFGSLVAQVLAR